MGRNTTTLATRCAQPRTRPKPSTAERYVFHPASIQWMSPRALTIFLLQGKGKGRAAEEDKSEQEDASEEEAGPSRGRGAAGKGKSRPRDSMDDDSDVSMVSAAAAPKKKAPAAKRTTAASKSTTKGKGKAKAQDLVSCAASCCVSLPGQELALTRPRPQFNESESEEESDEPAPRKKASVTLRSCLFLSHCSLLTAVSALDFTAPRRKPRRRRRLRLRPLANLLPAPPPKRLRRVSRSRRTSRQAIASRVRAGNDAESSRGSRVVFVQIVTLARRLHCMSLPCILPHLEGLVRIPLRLLRLPSACAKPPD